MFDKRAFQSFVSNKQFLPDSYTAFKNKIGLTAKGEYLTQSREVVLDWPYKDCVLEGGQTKDDQKRKEIFWNQTLAADEVDRLLEPKVLTNFKKYTKEGEEEVKGLSINDNLIIKGNNLLALHSLKQSYAGKVKLIYIDPPYNTGNDSFGYNDSFNHSMWLTFMKNRLEVAKELLSDDGVIFVQCDDNEQAYLKVLMDEVFGRDKFVGTFLWKKNKSGNQNAQYMALQHDYIMSFIKIENKKKWRVSYSEEDLKDYTKSDNKGVFYWKPVFHSTRGTDIKINYNGLDFKVLKSIYSKDKLTSMLQSGEAEFIINKYSKKQIYKKQRLSDGTLPYSLMDPKKFPMTENAVKEINELFKEELFKTPKPEFIISYLIDISTQPNDLVLDFHLGSGTTCAVAHKMGRRYIGIEQMDYIQNITCERLKKVIAGEQGGISKAVNWQGGGAFTYCELAENNAKIITQIEQANTSEQLQQLWQRIQNSDFISYQVKPKSINANIKEFEALNLDEQKQLLVELLDKNQLYVNYADIDDEDYQISNADKKLNRQFYGKT